MEFHFEREKKKFTKAAVSEAALRAYEKKHGIRFPKTLRDALLKMNGGTMKPDNFKVNGLNYFIQGFWGIITKGPGWPRLHPVSDYMDKSDPKASVWVVKLPNRKDDPKKIFLFGNLWLADVYYGLNWNEKSGEPSVWCFEETSRGKTALKLADSWDELLGRAYSGEKKNTVEFGAGWEGYTMLLKDSVDYTENPSTDRCNLGIKGSMVRVQVESIRDRESKSDDYRTLEEHEFRISKLDLSSLRVLNRRDCSKPTYSLGVAASMTERSSCSHYAEGDWQNSEGKDEFRVELRTSSLDGVLKAFRTLFDRAREEKVRKKPSRKKR